VIPAAWRQGEVAVVGLGRSGQAACALLRREGLRVYASDVADSPAVRQTAARLAALGCAVHTGGHDIERIECCTLVVLSPGVPPDAPPVTAAHQRGVPVIAELDLGARFLQGTRLLVVTGTNGKTTTAALIGHLLDAAGLGPKDAAGNIGLPLCTVAQRSSPERPAWLSVEASSFQLHDCPSLTPAVGVLTNLAPDHLDRYPSVEDYYADKKLMYRNASAASHWVTNGDDRLALKAAAAARGEHERFSLEIRQAEGFYDRPAGWLVLRGIPLLRRSDLELLGDHNVANALAASLAVPREAERDRLAYGLRTFRALPHRLETIREVGGVVWVNDSKATNVSSTLVALQSMERPAVVLLGGRHKGEPYTGLAPHLARARAVIAFGEAGPIVEQDLKGKVPLERAGDFADVMARAKRLAQPGDAVLLSPACSSYDMFDNYEHRGRTFREMVEAM
jgi:UDP-N-acetylmuramoylalanine--D-glutamate ligase